MHQVLVDFVSIVPSIWTPIQIAVLLALLFGYVAYHFNKQRKLRAEAELERLAPPPEFGVDYTSRPSSNKWRR